MKIRVSFSVDPKLIKEVDRTVDGIAVRSRSDALETMIKERYYDKRTAVIMCGGSPDRLLVPGLDIYRPLVKIGKKTLIEDIALKCGESKFENIIIVGFTSVISKIYEVLGNGEGHGVSVTYIEEKKGLGTAKTLELAKKYIKTDFLFLPCDHYFDFDLSKLYDFHLSQNGMVTLGVHMRTSFDWEGGIVDMEGFRITDFEEHPKKPKTHVSSLFIGFMKPDIFNYVPSGDVYWSLQENIFPRLAKEGKLIGYPVGGNWVNIHSKKDADKANDINKNVSAVK